MKKNRRAKTIVGLTVIAMLAMSLVAPTVASAHERTLYFDFYFDNTGKSYDCTEIEYKPNATSMQMTIDNADNCVYIITPYGGYKNGPMYPCLWNGITYCSDGGYYFKIQNSVNESGYWYAALGVELLYISSYYAWSNGSWDTVS